MAIKRCLFAVLAVAAVLSVAAPLHAATIPVFSYDPDTGLTCPSFCSISVPFSGGNLSAPTPAGYSALFGSTMVHNWSAGDPAGPVTIQTTGLPAHSSLNLGFLLAIIDSWDGNTAAGGTVFPDFLNVTVDGVPVYSETYDNFLAADQSASTANQLSFGSNLGFNPGWNDSAYDFRGSLGLLDIPHSASDVVIRIFASGAGWQGGTWEGGDESFGLDDIRVSVNVPEPGSLLLLGIGLAGLGARRRNQLS